MAKQKYSPKDIYPLKTISGNIMWLLFCFLICALISFFLIALPVTIYNASKSLAYYQAQRDQEQQFRETMCKQENGVYIPKGVSLVEECIIEKGNFVERYRFTKIPIMLEEKQIGQTWRLEIK